MVNINELCQRFETDIASGCHSTVIEYGRSSAQKALMAAFEENDSALKDIGGHIFNRTSYPVPGVDKSIQDAWGMLLSDIASHRGITHLDLLTHWAKTYSSK